MSRLGPAVLLASAALLPAGAQERLPWAEPVRACLDGDTRAFATLHGDMAGGAMLLVVHRADGTRELCEVEPSGRLRGHAPAPPDTYAPRPEDRAFFLERRCVDARRVESESGAILGWLAYPACG